MVKVVTDDTFETEVLKSKKPVIVDHWTPWCSPCLMMAPVFEELSKEMTNVNFCKLNVDENPRVAQEYEIRSIPTFLIFKNGKVIDAIVGGMSKQEFKKKLQSILQ